MKYLQRFAIIPKNIKVVDDRTGISKDELKRAFLDNLFYNQAKFPRLATAQDYYLALAYVVRDRMLQRWISTAETYTKKKTRTVCYLSAEYLLGPHLENNIINLGIYDQLSETIEELGLNLDDLLDQEEEPGLGNGGLGRLAACFLDSLASLEIPALGYGIRYEFGIFEQVLQDGWQTEKTDKWLRYVNPWEIVRQEWAVEIKFGGHTEKVIADDGTERVLWHPEKIIKGVPYDTPILGYRVNTANTLRLWQAEAPESFDFAVFNRGDYYGAVDQKIISENITKVLYPNDEQWEGKKLRLEQQFFFVSCSLQDMIRILGIQEISLQAFHEKFTIQLNDTHPAIAVAELMRLFVDEHHMPWKQAWEITQKTFAYTNHTLLPEALECWPVSMISYILPRHMEIIYTINKQFLDYVRSHLTTDVKLISQLSIISEGDDHLVRMAHLACVGSFAVNGVANLHSQLLKDQVLKHYYEIWPEKFSNKTNGVTPRRWMALCNRSLAALITERIGDDWVKNLSHLKNLKNSVNDSAFREHWRQIKHSNKSRLAGLIQEKTGVTVDPLSMFDVQVKRLHEYKRQHLNVLHIIYLYFQLRNQSDADLVPRTFIFGGKAAPGYHMAKLIIKLINAVGSVVNRDPLVSNTLKVVFWPNFNVSTGQDIYPAADLSEQISTAGKEASGTGNMKFAMNGALTIGTLDGANIEIREQVGEDNFFLFGLTAEQIMDMQNTGYHPHTYYEQNPMLKEVIDLISSGFFSNGDTELFRPIVDNLLYHDPYFLLADFKSYVDVQQQVSREYLNRDNWTRMSIANVAGSGYFSSDRTINEYAVDIWKVKKLPVKMLSPDDVSTQLGQ